LETVKKKEEVEKIRRKGGEESDASPKRKCHERNPAFTAAKRRDRERRDQKGTSDKTLAKEVGPPKGKSIAPDHESQYSENELWGGGGEERLEVKAGKKA